MEFYFCGIYLHTQKESEFTEKMYIIQACRLKDNSECTVHHLKFFIATFQFLSYTSQVKFAHVLVQSMQWI